MRTHVFTLAVATTLVACTPATHPDSVQLPGEPAIGHGAITVNVENDRPVFMKIFATRSNMRFLVGEVRARGNGTFRLPEMIMGGRGELRLVAEAQGSTQFAESEPIVLTDSRTVKWRLRQGGSARLWVQ